MIYIYLCENYYMARQRALSKLFPDRPPTLAEASAVVWIPLCILPIFLAVPLSWPAVLVGFLVGISICVPTDQTAVGRRIIQWWQQTGFQWWRRIGVGGRLVVFICAFGGFGLLVYVDWLLREQLLNTVLGFLFVNQIYILGFIVISDEGISGL